MGLGINIHRTQLVAFVLSGAFCGIAGALSVVNQQAAYPGMMDWNRSGDPVMASVMGGMYAFLGPVLGAIVFQLGHDLILRYTTRWQITLGVVILAIVLAFPDGVSGLFKLSTWTWAKRRLGRPSMGRAE
jgi:branched-chain amino acid transport system permease protein